MTELAQINAKLDVVLQKIAAMQPKRAPMTRRQFAEATGFCYKTICRWVSAGKLTEVEGRIPAKYLDSLQS